MSKIEENLYLGDIRSLQLCENLNIDIVISILESKPNINKVYPKIQHIYFNAEDEETFNISIYFDEFIKIIESNNGKNILVHCYSGVSRSASLIASYLIYKRVKKSFKNGKFNNSILKTSTVEKVLHTLKNKRPCVDPNDGFIKHLELFRTKCIDDIQNSVTLNNVTTV